MAEAQHDACEQARVDALATKLENVEARIEEIDHERVTLARQHLAMRYEHGQRSDALQRRRAAYAPMVIEHPAPSAPVDDAHAPQHAAEPQPAHTPEVAPPEPQPAPQESVQPIPPSAPTDAARPKRKRTLAVRRLWELSTRSVQNILLVLGALLLAIAVTVFTIVSWGDLGLGARAVTLAALTALVGYVPRPLLRYEMRATAEAVSGLAALVLCLDAFALWTVTQTGTQAGPTGSSSATEPGSALSLADMVENAFSSVSALANNAVFIAPALAVLAIALLPYPAVLTRGLGEPLRAPRVAAVLLAQPVPVLTALAATPPPLEPLSMPTALLLTAIPTALLLTCAGNALLLATVRSGYPRPLVRLLSAAGWVTGTVAVVVVLAATPPSMPNWWPAAMLVLAGGAMLLDSRVRRSPQAREAVAGVATAALIAAAPVTIAVLAADQWVAPVWALATSLAAVVLLLPAVRTVGPVLTSWISLALVGWFGLPAFVAVGDQLRWLLTPWEGAANVAAAFPPDAAATVTLLATAAAVAALAAPLVRSDTGLLAQPTAVLGALTVLLAAQWLPHSATLAVLVAGSAALVALATVVTSRRDTSDHPASVRARFGALRARATTATSGHDANGLPRPARAQYDALAALATKLTSGRDTNGHPASGWHTRFGTTALVLAAGLALVAICGAFVTSTTTLVTLAALLVVAGSAALAPATPVPHCRAVTVAAVLLATGLAVAASVAATQNWVPLVLGPLAVAVTAAVLGGWLVTTGRRSDQGYTLALAALVPMLTSLGLALPYGAHVLSLSLALCALTGVIALWGVGIGAATDREGPILAAGVLATVSVALLLLVKPLASALVSTVPIFSSPWPTEGTASTLSPTRTLSQVELAMPLVLCAYGVAVLTLTLLASATRGRGTGATVALVGGGIAVPLVVATPIAVPYNVALIVHAVAALALLVVAGRMPGALGYATAGTGTLLGLMTTGWSLATPGRTVATLAVLALGATIATVVSARPGRRPAPAVSGALAFLATAAAGAAVLTGFASLPHAGVTTEPHWQPFVGLAAAGCAAALCRTPWLAYRPAQRTGTAVAVTVLALASLATSLAAPDYFDLAAVTCALILAALALVVGARNVPGGIAAATAGVTLVGAVVTVLWEWLTVMFAPYGWLTAAWTGQNQPWTATEMLSPSTLGVATDALLLPVLMLGAAATLVLTWGLSTTREKALTRVGYGAAALSVPVLAPIPAVGDFHFGLTLTWLLLIAAALLAGALRERTGPLATMFAVLALWPTTMAIAWAQATPATQVATFAAVSVVAALAAAVAGRPYRRATPMISGALAFVATTAVGATVLTGYAALSQIGVATDLRWPPFLGIAVAGIASAVCQTPPMTHRPEQRTGTALAGTVLVLMSLAATLVLPSPFGLTAAAAGLVLATLALFEGQRILASALALLTLVGAAATVLWEWLTVMFAPYGWLTAAWTGQNQPWTATETASPLDTTMTMGPLVLPVLAIGAAATLVLIWGRPASRAKVRARLEYGAAALAVPVLAPVPAAWDLNFVVALGWLLLVATGLLWGATWASTRSLAPLCGGLALWPAAMALAWAMATPATTLGTLLAIALIAGAYPTVGRSVAVTAGACATATLATGGFSVALLLARDQPAEVAALALVAVVAGGAGTVGAVRLATPVVLAVEGSLAALAVAAVALTLGDPDRLLLTVAVLALIAVATGGIAAAGVVRPERPVTLVIVFSLAGLAVAAVALTLGDSGRLHLTSVALAALGVILMASAQRPRREWLGPVGAILLLAALWVLLGWLRVTEPEPYLALPALATLALGWNWRRQHSATEAGAPPRSWLAYGPGLALAMLPTLAIILFTDDSGPIRLPLLALAALAVTLLGVWRRLQAPLFIGATVLLVVGINGAEGSLTNLVLLMDRWVPVALVGLLLLGMGARYERNLRDLRSLGRAIRAMD